MSVLTLGVALAVSGLFVLLAWKAHEGIAAMRSNLAIEAFFDPGLSSNDAQNIANTNIKTLAGVSRVEFISKEQALNDYASSSGENVERVLGMNPLPASVKVYLSRPDVGSAASIESALRAIEGVQDVRTNTSLLAAMTERAGALDRVALIVGSLMILSALFFALIAGRHNVELRKNTTHTFALLGASTWSTKAPVLIATSLGGVFGGIIATLLLLVVHSQLLAINAGFSISIAKKEIIIGTFCLAALGLLIATAGALGSNRNPSRTI